MAQSEREVFFFVFCGIFALFLSKSAFFYFYKCIQNQNDENKKMLEIAKKCNF